MDELKNIANTLSALYADRADIAYNLRNVKNDREAAEVNFPDPAEGWPGKTEADRTRARRAAIASDPAIRAKVAAESGLQFELDRNQAAIDGASDVRRAIEWNIRQAMVTWLASRGSKSDDADYAFDKAVQDKADQSIEQSVSETIDLIL